MAENSPIEWTDHTWSPWEGCTRVSIAATGGGGCDNCYAEAMNRWLRKGENWGPGAPRRIYSEDHWEKPIRWQRNAPKFHTLHGRRQRVFPSVCDPFDNEVHEILRTRLWGLIRLTPAIDWLLLTKRIGNAKAMLPEDWGDGYPNVWLGATVVNQEEADRDILKLIATPARVRFLSIEPMLGPISLRWLRAFPESTPYVCQNPSGDTNHLDGLRRLDWVITGGESGPKARPAHPDWFRSLRDQCADAGVPFLFKQWGEWLPVNQMDVEFMNRLYKPNRVAKLHEDQGALNDSYGRRCIVPQAVLQADGLQVDIASPMAFRQGLGSMQIFRAGKKAAGRLLDGIEHNGYPGAA